VARVVHRLRSVLALSVLLALAVGVPTLLAFVAGWPSRVAFRIGGASRPRSARAIYRATSSSKVLAVLGVDRMGAGCLGRCLGTGSQRSAREPRARAQPAPLVPAAMGKGVGRLVALVLSIGITLASTPTPLLARPPAGVVTPARQSSIAALTVDATPEREPGGRGADAQLASCRR